MKLLYLVIGGVESPGVSKKIVTKIKSFNESDIKTHGLLFTYSDQNSKNAQYSIESLDLKIPKWLSGKFFWRFLYLYKEILIYRKVRREVKKYDFDYILFRYPGANYSLTKFTSQFKDKIIFELNARVLTDLLKYNIHNSFLDKYMIWSEKYFFKKVIKNSKAIISVTEDILRDELSRSKLHKPSLVLANGVNVESIKLRTVPALTNRTINMCISIGSSNNLVFGLERLARSFRNYKGNYSFNVYIAGIMKTEQLAKLNELADKEAFFYKGMLNAQELHVMYSECHVAFAALAMYELGAEYSSSLKVKEYLASGIPFFLAYTEPVLNNIKDIDAYFLRYENNSELLNIDKLTDFVISYSADADHPSKMRTSAASHIDYKYIAKDLQRFLNTLN